jgi:hypothetical protein
MAFGDYVKKGWDVARLKTDAIQSLAEDKDALGPAIGILAIGGACGAFGMLNFLGIIYMPILRIIGAFIMIGIMHFVATAFFSGKGEFKSLFAPLACATLISWVGVIPLIGPVLAILAGLWLLVVFVLGVEVVHQIDRPKAIAVVAIPVVIGAVLLGIALAIVGVSMLALTR